MTAAELDDMALNAARTAFWDEHNKPGALFSVSVDASIKAAILAYLAAKPQDQGQVTEAQRDVIAERARQISVEGWTAEHDDAHGDGDMARAGAAYALHMHGFRGAPEQDYRIKAHHPEWPWDRKWWKPKDPRRDLVRAAALIIAEIERLDRLAASRVK